MRQEKCDSSRSLDLGSPTHKVGENLFFYSGDVNAYRVPGGSCDAVVLDMMEPWIAVECAAAALKSDRSLLCVCPNITQVTSLISYIKEKKIELLLWRTVEVSHRSWDIRPPAAHPSFRQVGHTAFLVELRKSTRPFDPLP
eukprot:13617_1